MYASWSWPEPWLLGRTSTRNEGERDTVHFGVLRLEAHELCAALEAQCCGRVASSTQRPTHNLLAQKLRSKRAHAEHMCHSVRVPALGEHRYADDALHVLP